MLVKFKINRFLRINRHFEEFGNFAILGLFLWQRAIPFPVPFLVPESLPSTSRKLIFGLRVWTEKGLPCAVDEC